MTICHVDPAKAPMTPPTTITAQASSNSFLGPMRLASPLAGRDRKMPTIVKIDINQAPESVDMPYEPIIGSRMLGTLYCTMQTLTPTASSTMLSAT